MKKILLLSLTTLISFNTIADYKVYGSQKNSLPIPKERPLFEQKISFESDESHDNLSISGYFIKRSNPEINTIPIEPTDGNIILAPYRPGNQWGEFYTYITFTVPDYVKTFKLSFNYSGYGGSSNGIPYTEFKFQKALYENSNFITVNTMSSPSYYWKTYNNTNIINNQNRYRIETRIGTDSSKSGSNLYAGIDNITITEIKSE